MSTLLIQGPVARETTGGPRWHLRALLRRRQWRETTLQLADWLEAIEPWHPELLLIGGSAGWMMSGRWLQRFERVVLVDIDPHACRLFRWNHGRAMRQSGTVLEALQTDAMQDLESLLAAYPDATVFFDNVLGQHLFRIRDMEQAERELDQIASRMAGRDWGSVHDLYSGQTDPSRLPDAPLTRFDAMNTDKGLVVEGLAGAPLHKRLLAQVGACGEWMDHLTSGVFPVGTQTRLFAWPFQPEYAHWLQAGWMTPMGKPPRAGQVLPVKVDSL